MPTKRTFLRSLVLLLVAAALALPVATATTGAPAGAETPAGLFFIACTPKDKPAGTAALTPAEQATLGTRTWTRRTDAQIQELVLSDLRSYFRTATLGRLTNINYFFDWVRVDQTTAQFTAAGTSAFTRWQACVDKAQSIRSLPASYAKIVMLPSPWCAQGNPGWACVATGHDPADIAHEASHALGLSHSWGGTPSREYGDLYSVTGDTAQGFQYRDSFNARWGPGYTAPDLQALGYMPASSIWSSSWPTDDAPRTVTLTALSHHLDGGYLMARFPGFGGASTTLEYRTKDGPDAGIPGPAVVLHEVGSRRDMRIAVAPGTARTYNGVSIRVSAPSGNRVTVRLQRTFPETVYNVKANGDLMCQRHIGYTTGDASWTTPVKVGNGWGGFTKVFTVSGSIYGLLPDGTLRWYRHYGADDCSANWNASGGKVALAGLKNVKHIFGMPTAMTPGGIIYVVKNDGRLLWYRHEDWGGGSNVWTGPVQVGWGFESATAVFPGAEGVIYLRDANGDLWWYRHLGYRTGENTWQGWRNLVGTSWNGLRLIGGSYTGVIYTIRDDGTVRWYRHTGWLQGTQSWDPQGATLVRYGWGLGQKFIFQRSLTPERPIG